MKYNFLQSNVGVFANVVKANLQIHSSCATWCHLKQTFFHILESLFEKTGFFFFFMMLQRRHAYTVFAEADFTFIYGLA